MAYRYGDDRRQQMFFPTSIDQYVAEDHPVRAYDAFVDSLDFEQLGISLNERKVGNSQYDPRLMLKLLLYGYSYGMKSSRKLERELHNNLSFIWLMKNLKPDHKTIAEFRRNNKLALKKALRLCARLCLHLGLIEGNILFVDSTKLRANAGKANDHHHPWYRQQLQRIDDKIRKLLAECEHIDLQEAQQGSMVKMPKELAKATQLKARIQSALEQFAHRGTKNKDGNPRKVNLIDPQSALMKTPQGTYPSYSMQSVVDDKHGLIVHTDAVSDANDTQQLASQIRCAEETLERACQVACADAGYSDIEQIEKIDSDQCSVVVPTKQQASDKPLKPFSKCDFTYDPRNDCYWCPQGNRLIFRRFQDKEHKKRDYRIEKPALCRTCQHFGQCTNSKHGRTVVRHIFEKLSEKVQQRLKEPAMEAIYQRRKARVEHPFGYIKKNLGFSQMTMRGRLAAQAESSLLAICFNLTRMIRLLGGVQGFKARLASL
jgi:transposase